MARRVLSVFMFGLFGIDRVLIEGWDLRLGCAAGPAGLLVGVAVDVDDVGVNRQHLVALFGGGEIKIRLHDDLGRVRCGDHSVGAGMLGKHSGDGGGGEEDTERFHVYFRVRQGLGNAAHEGIPLWNVCSPPRQIGYRDHYSFSYLASYLRLLFGLCWPFRASVSLSTQ